jgi:hypothetical protein
MPVLQEITRQADGVRCAEPEQSIKAAVVAIIEQALTAYPSGAAVRVTGQGSQSIGSSGRDAINSLDLKIESLFGFVE